MTKYAKERTLEQKIEQIVKDHQQMIKDQEQMKFILQYIQVNNLRLGPSNLTPNGYCR